MIELVNNLVADHRNTAEPLRMGPTRWSSGWEEGRSGFRW